MTLADKLSKLYPPDRLLIDPAHLATYESDALTAFQVLPQAIVIPESAEEVIATVRFCKENEIPFVARGSGTSLSGGSLPIENGLVIALNRLNHIINLNPDDRTAVVEPGVLNLQVSDAAMPHGLHYAPDPSSQQICTIGGNVAFNSGGAHCLKYGMTSNHVLGIKAVLATGEVVEFGGASRDPIGPDMTGLFVGNEGLFGIALEITLRLVPRAECFHTVLASYETLEAAGDAVAAVVASGLLPGAIEIMDRLAIKAAEKAVRCGYPKNAEAVMIVELEGPEEEVSVDRVKLAEIIDASHASEMKIALDDDERMMIWKGRKSAFSAVGRLSPDFIVQDGVVPRKRLGEALRKIDDMSKETGIRVANVFHAGDGNLHPLILYNGRESGALERAEEMAGRILRMCIEMGGSITGEHGIGVEKREFLPEQFCEDDISAMKRIRHAFDPCEIANRGKMFPGSDAPSLTMTGLHPLEEAGVISREEDQKSEKFMLAPKNITEVQQAVRTSDAAIPVASNTKPALTSVADNYEKISMLGLSGVVEYEPSEFTITVLAGTKLSDLQQVLDEQGQYLPFDPPLARAGATIGGTVASGLSGPGAYRFGPIRDFLIGVRYVDGDGTLISGGGKVVKNAAGFDTPKFLIGSLGRLGVLVELSFKVFPRPASTSTFSVETGDAKHATELISQLSGGVFDLDALDYLPEAQVLYGRLAGNDEALAVRMQKIEESLGSSRSVTVINPDTATTFWQEQLDFAWTDPDHALAKFATTPSAIQDYEALLQESNGKQRYSIGGNNVWVNAPADFLKDISIPQPGLLIQHSDSNTSVWTGSLPQVNQIQIALKQALDVPQKFPPLHETISPAMNP